MVNCRHNLKMVMTLFRSSTFLTLGQSAGRACEGCELARDWSAQNGAWGRAHAHRHGVSICQGGHSI